MSWKRLKFVTKLSFWEGATSQENCYADIFSLIFISRVDGVFC